MKLKTPILTSALALAGALLAASPAQAVLTTYSAGDLFLGFRQAGAANSLAVNIGSASKYIPVNLGGTASGSFNVQFGVIPNTSTAVTNLNADLEATFGDNWAANPNDGTGVKWAVVGYTSNALDDVPIDGLNARSLFVTKARTNPDIQSTPSASLSNDSFANSFTPFATGVGAGSYINQNSTANSSVAYSGSASLTNNWNTKIGVNGAFGLGGSNKVEQAESGDFSGPTNSVLDLYLAPSAGSDSTSITYLGSFSLNELGELTYTAVPEPSTYALLAIAGIAFMTFRRRQNRIHATVN